MSLMRRWSYICQIRHWLASLGAQLLVMLAQVLYSHAVHASLEVHVYHAALEVHVVLCIWHAPQVIV